VSVLGDELEDTDQTPNGIAATLMIREDWVDGPLTLTFAATNGLGEADEVEIQVEVVNSGSISGQVVKGPVEGAVVEAFDWEGGRVGESLGLATQPTSAAGEYSISVGQHRELVLLRSTGGSFLGEARNPELEDAIVEFGVDDVLEALVNHQSGTTYSAALVTPLTYISRIVTENLVVMGHSPEDALAEATSRVEEIFGVSLAAVPHNPAEPATSLSDAVKAGLLLAGLDMLGKGYRTDALEVVRVVAADLSDGILNGMRGNVGLYLGEHAITANLLRASLGRAVLQFVADTQLCKLGSDFYPQQTRSQKLVGKNCCQCGSGLRLWARTNPSRLKPS
jgi:hypothetical protein